VAGHTDNEVTIQAPLEAVWDTMNDIENWPRFLADYSKVEILERSGNTTSFRIYTQPDPEFNNQVWTWVSERTIDSQDHTVKSHRVETGNFEHMHIRWFFEPVDGGTRMRWVQDFHMKDTAPLDDRGMEQRIDRNTQENMARIKQYFEQGAQST
jgi:aromatase